MDFEQQKQPQSYDSSLKALVQQQASDILPLFLPGAIYEETLNVEIIRPKLMQRVMDELKELYRDDEVTVAQQLVWMELLLGRTDTVPIQEKEKIRRGIKMYDPSWEERLWEEHPKVQQIRAESEAKGKVEGKEEGKAEGIVQGELLALRRLLVSVVKARFPSLAEVAQREAEQIEDPELLDLLIQKMIATQDELAACWLLSVRDFERS